jgi:hypothetical protein
MRTLEESAARLRRLAEAAERAVSPERTIALVTIVAAALLAVSQFVDYRGVQAGFEAYRSVSDVVSAPIIEGTRATAGSAHLYLLLAAAVVAIWALAGALAGRLDRARLIWAAGVAGVAVSLVIDLPKGLNEGNASIDHADAHATLLAGFYVQLATSALLVLCGSLLIRYLQAPGTPP